MSEQVDDKSSKTSAPSQPDVSTQIRSEFEKQKLEEKINTLYARYSESLESDRLKKAFSGLLRGIQKESEEQGRPVGTSNGISVEQAFDVAYETLTGYKFGETPVEPEDTEDIVPEDERPSPPGKQATTKSKGVATQVTEDKEIEIGDVPTEDVQMYVDVANTLRQRTKTLKSDGEARDTVGDIIRELTRKKHEDSIRK